MSQFEYLTITYTLVLSFAGIRLVEALPHTTDATRRYWVHVIYVFLLLIAALVLFWTHWSTNEIEWTFLTFTINLLGPGVIYFLSCIIVPNEPEDVGSWFDYFFSVRRKWFAGICIWAWIMAANTTLVLGTPLIHSSRIIQIGLLILGLSGLATDKPRIHGPIVALALLVVIIATAILYRPGALTG